MFNPKKRLMFALFVISIIAIVAGCGCKSAAEVRPDSGAFCELRTDRPKPPELSAKQYKQKVLDEYEVRKETQKLLLSDASWLAKETGDKQALEISELLEANAVTYINIGPHLVTFDVVERAHRVPMVLIMGDELKDLEITMSDEVIAQVLPLSSTPLFLVRDMHASKLANALVILHEGEHLVFFFSLPDDAFPMARLDVAREEVRAYELEIRLLDKVGGEKYASLVNAQIDRIEKNLPPSPDDKEFARLRDDVFNNVFEVRSAYESRYFRALLLLEANYRIIEKTLPDKSAADNIKATMYLESNDEKPKE